MNASDDTICAIATAPGGAIGIVRISGARAVEVADMVFSASLTDAAPYTVRYGRIVDGGTLIDSALATVFRAPHSYTGEDSVELACHGSAYVLAEVCRSLIAHGCRQAEPGEFTQRAFLNGKMDLAQAEAVADLIASRTRAQHTMAMSQLRGTFSRHIDHLHDRLLHLTTLMELELDFSDHEELEFADRSELRSLTDEILATVTRLADSFATGNAIKEGVRVAIVGPTNAGKSTLLNAILHEERAIVSDIHGTTRDTIEDTFVWQGITFRFIDTAGLRHTTDTVERIGIDRTHRTIAEAQIVLFLVDSATADRDLAALAPTIQSCPHPHLILLTKADKANSNAPQEYQTKQNAQQEHQTISYAPQEHQTKQNAPQMPQSTSPSSPRLGGARGGQGVARGGLSISALTGEGLDQLEQWVCDTARQTLRIDGTDLIVSNLRHHEALLAARDALLRVRDGLATTLPTDLVSQDLRDALHHLATITHRTITPDTVLHNVFRHFCIGK
ncbi:MAG: tRNA uridine-5-carboxymethylaminomethyl(34) synthesis GTPase MnmE [Bacteroidaceae bacterium]|nr:tRNA uridine-5-carboxymethylaminomethyl(34) synthesis GTPase MnmE [Bacteroidaceae bacterium]